jgi:RNA polymerase sigma factor (sigma-70 family)
LLARNDRARADPSRGRFRSWLRTCARHHLYNWFERRKGLRVGGRAVHVSIEAQHDAALPCSLIDAQHAERLYDRRWALTVVERALEQLRQRYQRANKAELFDALYAGLSGSAREENDAELARLLGKSVGAIRVERHRLRARFQECLKCEVAETVASASEIDDELRRLFAALS